MCQCGAHEGQKRVSDSPGAGVIQGDKLPDAGGAGNQAQAVCKSSSDLLTAGPSLQPHLLVS